MLPSVSDDADESKFTVSGALPESMLTVNTDVGAVFDEMAGGDKLESEQAASRAKLKNNNKCVKLVRTKDTIQCTHLMMSLAISDEPDSKAIEKSAVFWRLIS